MGDHFNSLIQNAGDLQKFEGRESTNASRIERQCHVDLEGMQRENDRLEKAVKTESDRLASKFDKAIKELTRPWSFSPIKIFPEADAQSAIAERTNSTAATCFACNGTSRVVGPDLH